MGFRLCTYSTTLGSTLSITVNIGSALNGTMTMSTDLTPSDIQKKRINSFSTSLDSPSNKLNQEDGEVDYQRIQLSDIRSINTTKSQSAVTCIALRHSGSSP